jgi:hypothetical protein
MSVERKILQEVERYKHINKYINEQEATAEPLGGLDLGATPEGETQAEPVDIENDPDVEVVDEPTTDTTATEVTATEDSGTEELDITELVTAQKDMSTKQEEYMETMINRLNDLTSKLEDMDTILQKINDLENKVEKYRQKTPEEKLQLRSLDSYPYNQKLSDFFMDKGDEMQKTGKNEYVLTSDEVQNYSEKDIRKSFDKPFEEDERM